MSQTNRANKVVRSDQEDRLSTLPDGVLHHILGFLPAHEAVRTSVLAPCWRDLWKYVRRLHVISPWDNDYYDDDGKEMCGCCDFINTLFLLRGNVILDEVKLDCNSDIHKDEHVNIWVRRALMWQPKVLGVELPGDFSCISLEGSPLVSRHLRKLELSYARLESRFLDFASCPALEVLEMKNCEIQTKRIFSQSIKVLSIESSSFTTRDHIRTRISAPSLIQLQLNDFEGKAPLLETMPALETACVKPCFMMEDSCEKGDSGGCCGICADCCGADIHKGRCVLLEGLSSVVNLALLADPSMILFRKDMNWCPTFCKLKKLLLNDWCLAIDFFALTCILKHSPILENLTLELHTGSRFAAQIGGTNTLIEKPCALSKCLKIIKIKCEDVDDRVCKLLKFLSTLDIEVTIRKTKELSRIKDYIW